MTAESTSSTPPTYEKVRGFLNAMGLGYIEKKDENKLLLANYIDEKYYFVYVLCEEDWIYTNVRLLNGVDIPEDKKEELFRQLLILNKNEKDLTFSLDEEDNVYSENDSPLSTNYLAFKSEYMMTVKGISLFSELANKLGIEIEGTAASKARVNESVECQVEH